MRAARTGLTMLLLAGCSSLPPAAPPASTPAATGEPGVGVDASRLSAHVRVLASDELEGRAPGSEGERRTLAYLTEQFAAAGAEPGGPGGSWTQPVDAVRLRPAAPPRLQVSGGGGACDGALREDDAIAWTRRAVEAVEVREAPLVFAGYGVHAPERAWDDYGAIDMAGKVGVVLMNDPDYQAAGGAFEGPVMTWYGRWLYKAEELARRGAAGVVFVFEPDATGLAWPVLRSSYGGTMMDLPRSDRERLPFEAWVTAETAARWLSCAGSDLAAAKAAAQGGGFRAHPIGALRVSAELAIDVERITTHNVLALVRGRARPDEVFVYTAHWDHLGRGAPDARGDEIYNGALDNAGGVAFLLELARLFAASPPARSVLLLATTLEEVGLLGAEHYAANPVFPLELTVGGINMDAVNFMGPTDSMVAVGKGKTTLEDDLEAELARRGRRLLPNPDDAVGFYFRSDHFPFAKRGVPFLFPGSGWEIADRLPSKGDPEGLRYHRPSDEWGPELDFAAAAADLAVYHAVGARIADSGHWPAWKAGAEFGPLRESSDERRRER